MYTVEFGQMENLYCALDWYFVTKIVLTYCEKNGSSDREKLLIEIRGQEYLKILRSPKFIQTVKGQKNFW